MDFGGKLSFTTSCLRVQQPPNQHVLEPQRKLSASQMLMSTAVAWCSVALRHVWHPMSFLRNSLPPLIEPESLLYYFSVQLTPTASVTKMDHHCPNLKHSCQSFHYKSN